ncbi:MAG: beta-N-acetylglucosaminidase domain-containing protein [Pacificimonas sp.]
MSAADNRTSPSLGIVEGYFGPPWSWADRTHAMRILASHGFTRFFYAPKADAHLRRRWDEAHSAEQAENIGAFAHACRKENVRFGIGLTPFELHRNWTASGRERLRRRVGQLADLGLTDLAILFDDMKGDVPDLAAIQADIMVEVRTTVPDLNLTMCPSYYSEDPVLDRVFGQRPNGYLADLGHLLPADIDIFWTGPEVCSRELSPGHLERIGDTFARKPVLWDNYPVNDGPRMSGHLHLRGMTGRGGIGDRIGAHYINPALQPHLTLVPALTLATMYRQGGDYDYLTATHEAAHTLLPAPLADALMADLLTLQDAGRARIHPGKLQDKYAAFDHPAAQEIVRFLAGDYETSAEDVQTQ